MSDADFEYRDDDVDEDFEDDQDGDSDYEEGPAKRRRGNQKPAVPKKAAKPAKPSKAAKPKKPDTPVNKSTARSKKARGGADQAPRALEKARRDVKLKISKGQPPDVGDRALRCLPYRTRNRAPKRELMRWTEDTYQQTLLAMVWVQEVRDVPIPWDEIAAVVHPGATGEAFKQALAKLRVKRVKDDLPVPPLRPGKDRPRQDCVEELENIIAEAQQARDRNAGKVKGKAKAVASNAGSWTDESSDDTEKSAKPKKKAQSSRKRPANYDDGGEPSVEDDTEASHPTPFPCFF
ncbi:RNA-binding protein cabeza-like protein [Neofusicoccum parvum]|uniref:RNA-binding protein cabeza-like protein n=1 Tax=Neofusicoccum parvum TaxID=310453 RepID=A0ACB5RRR8_9PEZI|nr:RNA-binding protein cabeza-like protein [Neofusicoccum parvum]